MSTSPSTSDERIEISFQEDGHPDSELTKNIANALLQRCRLEPDLDTADYGRSATATPGDTLGLTWSGAIWFCATHYKKLVATVKSLLATISGQGPEKLSKLRVKIRNGTKQIEFQGDQLDRTDAMTLLKQIEGLSATILPKK